MYERFVAVLALSGAISGLNSDNFLSYVSGSYLPLLNLLNDNAARVRFAVSDLYVKLASQAYQVILHSNESLDIFFQMIKSHLKYDLPRIQSMLIKALKKLFERAREHSNLHKLNSVLTEFLQIFFEMLLNPEMNKLPEFNTIQNDVESIINLIDTKNNKNFLMEFLGNIIGQIQQFLSAEQFTQDPDNLLNSLTGVFQYTFIAMEKQSSPDEL